MAEFSTLDLNQSIPSAPGTAAEDALGLSNPDSMLAGQLRGTQNVGSGGTQIDAANNRIVLANNSSVTNASVGAGITLDGNSSTITITNSDGSKVGMGLIPGSTTDFGFFVVDANGNLVSKIVGPTMYAYDIANGKTNVMQLLKLPDGSYGIAVANTGQNVSAGFA